MTNLKKIIQGVIAFFAGYLAMYILNFILPSIVESLETIFNSTDISSTIWMGSILIWVLMTLIIPSFYIISGLREGQEQNKSEVIIAILIFLFSIIFTVKAWYMVNVFADLAGTGLIAILYWMGLIAVWLEVTIITPTYMIIKNTN